MACSENIGSTGDGFNQMEDILSGTMVASDSYKPFEDFVCQTKLYGDASGAVDFIWVVDNSGSMIDEQEAVSQTVEMFTERLNSSGINYRLGVTTTDAYSLDEADEGAGYNLEWPSNAQSDSAYPIFRETGLRPFLKVANVYGFLDQTTRPSYLKTGFQAAVTDDANCNVSTPKFEDGGKNICGYGIEDGLKSLETVLDRLSNPSLSMIRFMLPRSSASVLVRITFRATGSIFFTEPKTVSYRPPALCSSGTKTEKLSSGCRPLRSASAIRESF